MTWLVEVRLEFPDDVPTVFVEGDLDLTTGPALEQVLRTLHREGRPAVRVDLAGARWVDSSGVRVIAAAANDLRHSGGTLVVTCASRRTGRAFRVLGRGDLLDGIAC